MVDLTMPKTDEDFRELKRLPKSLGKTLQRDTAKMHWSDKRGHLQADCKAFHEKDGSVMEFDIYLRQNTDLKMHDDFSCGIIYKKLHLARYNGSSHRHPNDKRHAHPVIARGICHIHEISEKALKEGKKPEHYANPTKRYETVEGALRCLIADFNIIDDVDWDDLKKRLNQIRRQINQSGFEL